MKAVTKSLTATSVQGMARNQDHSFPLPVSGTWEWNERQRTADGFLIDAGIIEVGRTISDNHPDQRCCF